MTILQRLMLISFSLVLLFSTIELIRRRRLREEYSLLWFLTGGVILIFALFPQILYQVSILLTLHHLTMMLFVVALFLFLIILHYSTVISQISERETELAQQVALLNWQVEQLSVRQMGEDAQAQQDENENHSAQK